MKQWLQGLAYRFQDFMRGRYGDDGLNRFMLIVALIIMVVEMFLPYSIARIVLDIIGWALIIFIIFRMFSKNTEKRRAENARFQRITERFKGSSSKRTSSTRTSSSSNTGSAKDSHTSRAARRAANAAPYRKENKVFKCRKCGQMLRVPKGKGKVKVTCPKCGESFIKRT